MEEIGLGYLSLDRGVGTLSGGEAQRCKIAKYINSSLSDVLYILDEPSTGLHDHDIERMKHSVRRLRDAGNTVLLVEHHREMMAIADHVVDMGPGPGGCGGEIVFEGNYDGLKASDTVTGRMLRHRGNFKDSSRVPVGGDESFRHNAPNSLSIFTLSHASLHNLKDITVSLPLGVLAVVAGVAGSGKSSLMECLLRDYHSESIYISQKNIGVSLRSTPATYLDVAPDIRKLFARCHKMREQDFTFNGKGGCPVCGGKGVVISEMAFMDNIETPCEACGGLRYSSDVLQYTVDGMNIAQVMDLSVGDAFNHFYGTPIAQKLHPLMLVGLDYLHLNQALSTLSGGELQRMKLASYLQPYTMSLRDGGRRALFVIDEPTDGLHLSDVSRLIGLFEQMVEAGNTVYVVEHNTDVIRAADYVVELGPGAGDQGGEIIYAGTPRGMLACPSSVTAKYL